MVNETPPKDFIREIVAADIQSGKHGGKVVTRFPPEPNGYLHIGHAKAICLDFGIAAENGGRCHLRMDDTNPEAEDMEYVEAIKKDVQWLGFDWGKNFFYAADYYDRMYAFAKELINKGHAYVCDLTAEEVKKTRGSLTEAGTESPYRNRTVAENLDLFHRMQAGEFAEGAKTLRAKIDMANPNFVLRDPPLYRIKKMSHYRTGDKWCIYPMYDYAHCIEDALEGITHSLCTLEFEVRRPLYDWVLNNISAPCHPQQIEFARLNLSYTVMSKRLLLQLVQEKKVSGWDDPRLPTLSGARRRGYTPEAIRNFCHHIGVAKREGVVDVGLLEHYIREDLNDKAPRRMAVLKPLKVVIENYPENKTEELEAPHHPQKPELGSRKIPFGREIYIEENDFMENPPKEFFRLAPGREVRLRFAYFLKCEKVIKDNQGKITELRCSYDPESKGGKAPDGRKVKATLHWVDAKKAVKAEVRLYDRLFNQENPLDVPEGESFYKNINLQSLVTLKNAWVEPELCNAAAGMAVQFERMGYFCLDSVDATKDHLVFNRTITLKDTWEKLKAAR